MRDIDLAAELAERSADEVTDPIASPAIAEAVAASFGALLADRDVAEIGSLEGGSVDVLRRGRRQRLDVILEGPLFALLREAGALTAVLTMRLPQGHELVAGPLAEGRIALRVVKSTALDATLDALIEEGVLPAGVDVELRAAVLEGAGVLVIGPARAARRRVLVALVRGLADRLALFGVTDSLSSLLPVPLARGAPLLDKARAAASLGADAVCALDLSPREALELARAELGVPFVVAIAVPSMDALSAAFAEARLAVGALGGTTAVIGHGPDGEARLVELHGLTRGIAPSPPPTAMVARGLTSTGTAPVPSARQPVLPAEVSGLRTRPGFGGERRDANSDDDLPPLSELPENWASDHADDDPGWELGDTETPAPGSFDAALASQKGKPSFAPRTAEASAARSPKPHPQTPQLKGGDPFGGLTFEPPPSGRVDDDEEGPR